MRYTNRFLMLGALAASVAGASVAEAASVDFSGSALAGNGLIDNSSIGSLSLSGDVNNFSPIDLSIVLDASEQGGSISFNGDFQVNTLVALTGYRIEVLTPGVTISVVGDVLNSFGNPMATSGDAFAQDIGFAPSEDLFFEIGDPLLAGSTDWALDVGGLAPGVDRFSVRLTAIPEPGTALLLGLGLAALAQRGRARRG
jgi:hypothetical protein